jgi:hypothetical protein
LPFSSEKDLPPIINPELGIVGPSQIADPYAERRDFSGAEAAPRV